jgi:hypothetical protein
MHRPLFVIFALSGLVIAATGCSPATEAGAETVKCGTGQVIKYDANTGAPYCAFLDDLGNVDDGTISDSTVDATVDSTTDSTVSDVKTDADAKVDTDAAVDSTPDIKPDVPKVPDSFKCPIKTPGLGGKIGTACTKDEDCKWGSCFFGPPLAGYDGAIGICAKSCSCTGGDANMNSCYYDDTPDLTESYKCVMEKTAGAGNKLFVGPDPVKMCARTCKKDADCVAWNPEMPNCINGSTNELSSGASVCGKAVPQ